MQKRTFDSGHFRLVEKIRIVSNCSISVPANVSNVAVCCSLRNSQNRLTKSRSLSLWLRQDKLTFILIDRADGTSFAGDVNIFFGQAQPYNRNEHRTSMLNRGSPIECESNMSRLVMYWQCKQGWRDGVFENGTRQDMVSPWSHAVQSDDPADLYELGEIEAESTSQTF